MPLGTSVDPNFYQEKAARAGQLIQLLLQNQQRKAAQRDAREKEQLNFFFNAAQSDPSLANSMGPDLVEKYGDKYPILPALVNSLQERQKIAGNMDVASKAFTDKLTSMQTNYQQMQEHAASLPDTLPFHVQVPTVQGQVDTGSPSPWLNQQARESNASFADMASSLSPGITLQIPNPEKAKAQATLAQINPIMFPVSAKLALPADQQALVGLNPALAHILPPKMPSYEDLPIEERPLAFAKAGLISPEQLEAAKMKIGMIPKPATIQEQQAARAQEEYKQTQENEREKSKQAHSDAHTQKEFENQKTIENLKNVHSTSRINTLLGGQMAIENRKIQGQKEVLEIRQGADGTVSGKSIADSSNAQMSDWRQSYRDFLEAQRTSKERDPDVLTKAQNDWLAKHPQPVRVPDIVARTIALNINREVKADPGKATSAPMVAQGAIQMYTQAAKKGAKQDEALSIALHQGNYQSLMKKYGITPAGATSPVIDAATTIKNSPDLIPQPDDSEE